MSVDLSPYFVDADSSEPITALQHNNAVTAIQVFLNNIQSDQIVAGSLELNDVTDGAVPETDVTTTGEVNKIPKLDSSANLIIADGGAIKWLMS